MKDRYIYQLFGCQYHLHSSMDRFEVLPAIVVPSRNSNLHSSMDRFEDVTNSIKNIFKNIYIPVWIDLKSFSVAFDNGVEEIYIPVWIDLKQSIIISVSSITNIYIPVWIDLKAGGLWLIPWLEGFTFQYG